MNYIKLKLLCTLQPLHQEAIRPHTWMSVEWVVNGTVLLFSSPLDIKISPADTRFAA